MRDGLSSRSPPTRDLTYLSFLEHSEGLSKCKVRYYVSCHQRKPLQHVCPPSRSFAANALDRDVGFLRDSVFPICSQGICTEAMRKDLPPSRVLLRIRHSEHDRYRSRHQFVVPARLQEAATDAMNVSITTHACDRNFRRRDAHDWTISGVLLVYVMKTSTTSDLEFQPGSSKSGVQRSRNVA